MEKCREIIEKLSKFHSLDLPEYRCLIENFDSGDALFAQEKAVEQRKAVYQNKVFIRGLIEISNYCKNDCFYCGIQKSNKGCSRYRLSKEQILACCDEGYKLGFRTFVLQGGEDPFFTDGVLCGIISAVKEKHPDCAVTLSLGERTKESYQRLFDSGADRYLLRHETASPDHYKKLHPEYMSWQNRINCLKILKQIGYQTGCGFMVGSPYQTPDCLALDLKFIEEFKPDMCGIGPFIPHSATRFAQKPAGSIELTLFLLSLIRLISPNILLPATTALGSLEKGGRERGISAGANVIMPNLSPFEQRRKYELYNNKLFDGNESAQVLAGLKNEMKAIGYEIVTDRGDKK